MARALESSKSGQGPLLEKGLSIRALSILCSRCRLVCLHGLDGTSRLSSHLSALPLGPRSCAGPWLRHCGGGGRKDPQAIREELASPPSLGAGWWVLLSIHLQQIPQKSALLSPHPTFCSEPHAPASWALASHTLRLPGHSRATPSGVLGTREPHPQASCP